MNATDASIVLNAAVEQAFGKNALSALNTEGLVSFGNKIVSSQINTDAFLNALMGIQYRSIYVYRKYRNKLEDLIYGASEWGQYVRKLYGNMPDSETDQTVNLENGQSVDHYVINKPDVTAKYFYTRAPYQFHVTIQKKWLKEAFTSYEEMGRLISFIFGLVRNKLEFSLESLARATLATYMAAMSKTPGLKVRNLVTEWNAANPDVQLTAASALTNEAFLRFLVGELLQASKEITDMSDMYNDGSGIRFTPFEDQRLKVLSRVQTQLQTQVEYAAFHKNLVALQGFKELNYWQSKKTPGSIEIILEGDTTSTKVENVVALLHDRDAVGSFRHNEDVATTPLNAAALYYNTYYHGTDQWFADMAENGVMFTLN